MYNHIPAISSRESLNGSSKGNTSEFYYTKVTLQATVEKGLKEVRIRITKEEATCDDRLEITKACIQGRELEIAGHSLSSGSNCKGL